MAQFRAIIRGQRGEASRLGSKNSGLHASINGWDGGVRVVASHRDGHDHFEIYATSGSNGGRSDAPIGCVDEQGVYTPIDKNKTT